MVEADLATAVQQALETDPDTFQDRVDEEASWLKDAVSNGTFDNPQGLIGLEYEFYAVRGADPAHEDAGSDPRQYGALCRIPRRTLSFVGFEKELGLHNAEMSTTPQPLNEFGLAGQRAEVQARLAASRQATVPHDMRLVSDGLWTIPPTGESSEAYLTDSVEIEGITIASNMSESVRYHAMANTDPVADMCVTAPHVSLEADTIMPESLITSIQPHYQVPRASDLAEYFTYALRIAAPLLALGVNSPLFPPDLYDETAAPTDILDDAHHENRIHVFESVLNADDIDKVRFPRDLESTEAAIDRIANDVTFVPMSVESDGRFDDRFANFRHKHGTYWRWIRPVFGGSTASDANARIEFRPLPGQPTIGDSIAFQAAFAGALAGMSASMHPVSELGWETARENFYAAVRDGLDADLQWITSEGASTSSIDEIVDDVLEQAVAGLRAQLITNDDVQRYLTPLRSRLHNRTTPASWQLELARLLVEDGVDFPEAVMETKRAYLQFQEESLLSGSFADWPVPEAAAHRVDTPVR